VALRSGCCSRTTRRFYLSVSVGPIGEGRQQVQVLTYHVGRACKRAITPRRLRIFAATCEPDHVPPPLCSVCYITLHAGTRGTLSTSKTPGDHVAVFNLAADGGTNNAGLNVVSANTAFSACEVSGHETGHGTLKISHVNPGPNPHRMRTPPPSALTCRQVRGGYGRPRHLPEIHYRRHFRGDRALRRLYRGYDLCSAARRITTAAPACRAADRHQSRA